MARTRATRRRGDGLGPWPAGWRSVARPTRYGNRHPLGTVRPCDACDGARHTAAEAVELYRAELLARPDLAEFLAPLADAVALVCSCPQGAPCHGDVVVAVLDELWPRPSTRG